MRGGVVPGSSPALGGRCAGKPWRHFSIVDTAGMKMPDKPSQCPSSVGLREGMVEVSRLVIVKQTDTLHSGSGSVRVSEWPS